MSDDDGKSITAGGGQRLDKWLWFARVIRTRTLAAGLVTDGRVRVNRERIVKPSQTVKAGDVITVAVGPRVRILEVVAAGERRDSAVEAQMLFRDLTPPPEPREAEPAGDAVRDQGAGRPTKRDRRLTDRLKGEDL